ncbi:F-box/kelch-repeat protein At3g06240-like [Malania oleifera]|uniref:F-box/kelch-repeat protein At3g06240-like n=1 Tax=Malania oleifera TaxID=397392 RepID=UPI0025AE3160|nr:F-box/kelch-repeat protein At3g06240-like [Malania oleifera]
MDGAKIVRVIVSCNGLVCLRANGNVRMEIHLWNLVIGEYIKLPYTFTVHGVNIFGFGYDNSINDFKLVRMHRDDINRFGAEIYTLGAKSRKKISNIPHGLPYSRDEGVLVNGALHWPAGTFWVVVAFDLVKETFQELPQPDYDDDCFGCENRRLNLGSTGGFLCIVCSYKESHDDVWIMKEDPAANCAPSNGNGCHGTQVLRQIVQCSYWRRRNMKEQSRAESVYEEQRQSGKCNAPENAHFREILGPVVIAINDEVLSLPTREEAQAALPALEHKQPMERTGITNELAGI